MPKLEHLIYSYLWGIKSQTLRWPESTNAGHALTVAISDLMCADYDAYCEFTNSDAYKLYRAHSLAMYTPPFERYRDFVEEMELPDIRNPMAGIRSLLTAFKEIQKPSKA